MKEADIIFMNVAEAELLYGSLSSIATRAGDVAFVTDGAKGAIVVQGTHCTELKSVGANAIDPTGAGDTFCGATLYGLAAGQHPVTAARRAMPLAAEMTERPGPAALLDFSTQIRPTDDNRVAVNPSQIDALARLIRSQSDFPPFSFTGPDLPPEEHVAAVDYFFAAALQQFGFWTEKGGRYGTPMIETIDGEERKGSFYLFRAYLRWLRNDPKLLTPEGQADLTERDLLDVLRADNAADPMPAIELHLHVARQYGRDMLAMGLTPQKILRRCNDLPKPLDALVRCLDGIGGYKEDPLRKKSVLLGLILRQRPEQFLRGNDDAPPVVDYHIVRACLRTGLIDVDNEQLKQKLERREVLAADDEWCVRQATYDAMNQLVDKSGQSMGAVDWFFFQGRKRCPELASPMCDKCILDAVCAHRKELFQPVYRTSFY